MTLAGQFPLVPNSELVAVAWIGSIPGIGPDIVATTLPPPADKDGGPSGWVTRGDGFAVVSVVGGNPDDMLPVHRPVLQVDTYATRPGADQPPWNIAALLAQTIVEARLDSLTAPRPLNITVKGRQYPLAAVQAARALTSPRRIRDDAGDYARYSFDLALTWITVGQVTD